MCNQSCQKAHKIESVKFDKCGYVWGTLFSCNCNFTPKVTPCNHMKHMQPRVTTCNHSCQILPLWFHVDHMISCTFCVVSHAFGVVSCGNQNMVSWVCCGFMSLTMISHCFGVEACCRHGFMFHPWGHVDHFLHHGLGPQMQWVKITTKMAKCTS